MPFSVVELFGAIEEIPQYIVEVQPLTKLCIGKITTHIWSVYNPLDLLIDYYNAKRRSKSKKKKYKKELNNDENTMLQFKQVIENITDQIINIEGLPKYMKVRISLQFLHLIQEMLKWCRILLTPALSHNNDFAVYFLNKTVFTPWGTVNMTHSVLRGHFDAYGNIELNQCLDIAYYCFFNSAIFHNYLQSNKYIKDKKLIKKVKKRMYKMTSYRKKWTKSLCNRISDSVRGTVEMLNYHYKIISCYNWEKFLYLVASFICKIRSKYNFSEKIIFIYHHLDHNIWETILEQFHMTIIPEIAISGQNKYCLLFYQQLIKINPEACLNIIAELMSITNEGSNHQIRRFKFCDKLYQENMKYTLMMIWENTPPTLKRDFIDKKHVYYYRCSQMFCYIDDYEFIKTFIKDAVLTEEERAVMLNYLVICHEVRNDDEFIKDNLLKLRNDFNFVEPNYSEEVLKSLLLRCCDSTYICKFSEHIFKCKNDLDNFKTSISKDHKFLMDVINNFRGQPNAANETNSFLIWCLIEDEDDPFNFINEHMTCNIVMVSVYLNFLSQKRKQELEEVPNNCNFNDVYNFSELFFDSEEFFHNILETILSEGYPEDITEFLKLGEDKEAMIEYLQSYLLSESGLRHILKIFVINHSENFAFTFRKLLRVISLHTGFKKKWLTNETVAKKFGEYLLNNGKEVYQKYFKHLEKNDSILCRYSEDSGRMWKFSTAVEYVYKIFAHFVLNVVDISNIFETLDLITQVSKPSRALRKVSDKIKVASITQV